MGDLPSVDKGRTGGVPLYVCDVDIASNSQLIQVNAPDLPDPKMERKAIPKLTYNHAFAGAALILMGYLLAYLVRFELLLGAWTTPYVLTVVVAVMVMVLVSVRNEEGSLRFGRAFGLAILAGFLARIGYNVFNVLLFHVLRPDLQDAYVDLIVDKAEEALVAFSGGALGDGENGLGAMLETSTRYSLTIPGQMVDAFSSLVWLAFVALIVAAILKRNPPQSGGFNG